MYFELNLWKCDTDEIGVLCVEGQNGCQGNTVARFAINVALLVKDYIRPRHDADSFYAGLGMICQHDKLSFKMLMVMNFLASKETGLSGFQVRGMSSSLLPPQARRLKCKLLIPSLGLSPVYRIFTLPVHGFERL